MSLNIVRTVAAAALALACVEPLVAQQVTDSDRQAAAVALALLEARGHLPERWVAAPFEILPGDGPNRPLDISMPYVHPTEIVPDTETLLTCDARRCWHTGDEPIPVMVHKAPGPVVQKTPAVGDGITLLVQQALIPQDPSGIEIVYYELLIEGLGTDQLSARIVREINELRYVGTPRNRP